MSAATTTTSDRLVRRSREALSALAVEFLLGMSVNLLPDDGAARLIRSIVLGLHVLIGIGIVIVAARLLAVARQEGLARREAAWGLAVVTATLVDGVLTVLLDSGWLSFVMAAGFLAATLLYVRTLLVGVTARRAL
ncbi:hypothetical protein [Amnibacterium sp.]|uniref:hypothetical protein n=1 Tax=Amnibacterium sp. TaxID=1872496 RepID=UPI0026276CA5|nr:hypothetical protein [Amnibacterium sp.]MCU1475135.1 hypothetical protein [Amnibacterium sp.]